MSWVQYTASTVRVPGHVQGGTYVAEIGLEHAEYRFEAVKDVQRSLSGRAETLTHSVDLIWTLVFERAGGADLLALREFLESTADGMPFRIWLSDRDADYVELRRADDSHGFSRTGGAPGHRGARYLPSAIEAREE